MGATPACAIPGAVGSGESQSQILSPARLPTLPYVIDAFTVTGRAVSPSDLDAELKKADQPVPIEPVAGTAQRRNELPADLAIVTLGK